MISDMSIWRLVNVRRLSKRLKRVGDLTFFFPCSIRCNDFSSAGVSVGQSKEDSCSQVKPTSLTWKFPAVTVGRFGLLLGRLVFRPGVDRGWGGGIFPASLSEQSIDGVKPRAELCLCSCAF